MMEGIERDGNHGTVLVRIEGIDYLVDAPLAAFSALPLIVGRTASTGEGIHDIQAVPRGEDFDVKWYPGSIVRHRWSRASILSVGLWIMAYPSRNTTLSALRDRRRSPFNDALFIGRHFSDRILNVGRRTRTEISADNVARKREITLAERAQILADEFGVSAEIIKTIPPDEEATL